VLPVEPEAEVAGQDAVSTEALGAVAGARLPGENLMGGELGRFDADRVVGEALKGDLDDGGRYVFAPAVVGPFLPA